MTLNRLVISLLFLCFSVTALAKFNPPPKHEPIDWPTYVRSRGISLSSNQYVTLHQYEALGNLERNTLAVDLPRLAESFPKQAQSWISCATTIIESSVPLAKTNDSFRRTRTDFLQATLAAMFAEGNSPRIATSDKILRAFKKYHGSAKSFYNVTAVFVAYSDIVAQGRLPSGKGALDEALIENKIANYKEKMDVNELPLETEAALRSKIQRKYHVVPPRHVASVRSDD